MNQPRSEDFDEFLDAVLVGERETRVIEIVDYRPEWAERFKAERDRIVAVSQRIRAVDATSGRVDLTGMLTHTYRLDDWRDAFTTFATQKQSRAIGQR